MKICAAQRSSEKGNLFLAIFGAIALVGVLGAGVMTFSKGPIQNSINLSRKNSANVEMAIAGQLAIMTATNAANHGDCDSDLYVEPPEWRDAGTAPKPTGGGLIPNSVAVPKKDPWGTQYGYCVWDHGPTRLNSACQTTPGTDKRLEGTDSKIYPVIAIISAGPDKVFTTTCRNFSTGATRADQNSDGDLEDTGDFPLAAKAATTDDDIIVTYSYNDALSNSGGLWKLKSSDLNTAYINKNIEAQGATVSGIGNFERMAAIGGDFIDAIAGLKLADPTVLTNCNSANTSILRRAASGYGIEMCNGTSWAAPGASAGSIDDLSDAVSNAANGNLFGGKNAGNSSLTGTYNTSFGITSLNALTTGSYNTALGYNALPNATTSSQNTAIGAYAANSMTGNSNFNTALGYEALYSCGANCSYNTASGYQAARASTASYNTVVGSQAMLSNVAGQYNTIAGTRAAKAATGGDNNAIVGYEAAIAQTSLSDNTLIGSNVMTDNAGTSTNNTIVGAKAAQAATTITEDVAYGQGAMTAVQTGSYNVAVGKSALAGVTTGTDNVAIGYLAQNTGNPTGSTAAGYSALANATGTRNTAAGNNAGLGITTGNDNTVVGSQAMQTGSADGSDNTVLGVQALNSTTAGTSRNTVAGYQAMFTAGGPKTDNVAIGFQALYRGITENYNTVVGYQAAYYMLGNYNTAIGWRALYGPISLASGVNNTGVGINSGGAVGVNSDSTFFGYTAGQHSPAGGSTAFGSTAFLNGAGAHNTAFGYASLLDGSSDGNTCIGSTTCAKPGNYNVAIGYSAMAAAAGPVNGVAIGDHAMNHATGSSTTNTAIGSQALIGLTSGSNNTGLGDYTIANNQTGTDNTAAGSATLQNTTGTGNTAVGQGALNLLTTSNFNTAAGYYAMASAVTPGDQNVAAGYYALNALTSANGTIGIGDQVLSTNTNLGGVIAIGNGITATDGIVDSIAIGYGASVTASYMVHFGNSSVTSISGQVAFTATSDRRVKKNIQPTDLGLDFILKLKPVSYRLIDGNGKLDYGFLAQDVETALEGRKTNMVSRRNDKIGTYRLRAEDLLAPMVKAVQEQQESLESLEKEVDSLH